MAKLTVNHAMLPGGVLNDQASATLKFGPQLLRSSIAPSLTLGYLRFSKAIDIDKSNRLDQARNA